MGLLCTHDAYHSCCFESNLLAIMSHITLN
nr:MAG TPA: hypothetical protein [Caudoviricetes sp.]